MENDDNNGRTLDTSMIDLEYYQSTFKHLDLRGSDDLQY